MSEKEIPLSAESMLAQLAGKKFAADYYAELINNLNRKFYAAVGIPREYFLEHYHGEPVRGHRKHAVMIDDANFYGVDLATPGRDETAMTEVRLITRQVYGVKLLPLRVPPRIALEP